LILAAVRNCGSALLKIFFANEARKALTGKKTCPILVALLLFEAGLPPFDKVALYASWWGHYPAG
jgi:hypothetical protein